MNHFSLKNKIRFNYIINLQLIYFKLNLNEFFYFALLRIVLVVIENIDNKNNKLDICLRKTLEINRKNWLRLKKRRFIFSPKL
jgi:hypothetical protein